jgi:glycosyltransferase involved in cell wall biosynthesis
MKLIIQIPCYNEECTLPLTVKDLPVKIDGIAEIEYLIINDGSSDRTTEIARESGVHHIVSFPNNRGLAKSFMAGIDACLRLGADIIVNTDGDNQYKGQDIEKLVQPILEGKAEIVVGDRQVENIEHFSYFKKKLQKTGSWVVRLTSGTKVADATSGFRAYSREAALRLNALSDFSYTLETIIDAGRRKTAIHNVKVDTNEKLRDSRLYKGAWNYLEKSATTIIRTYSMFKPLRVFLPLGVIIFSIGFIIGLRYIYFFSIGQGAGNVQSLILSSVLLTSGVQLVVFGLLADAIAANRKIIDELLYRAKRRDYDNESNKNIFKKL